MQNASLTAKLRYRIDNIFARGTGALIVLLAIVSLLIIMAIAIVVKIFDLSPEENNTFANLVWMGLMRTLDAGTMGGDGGSWAYRFAMLAVTIGGIFIVSTLIGVLSAGIEGRLESLRRGRSRVVESAHTVILGWSPHITTLISELIEANASQRDACIVILGDKDTVEMQDELNDKVGEFKTTRIVCRTGNPIDAADLAIVSLQTAKSIIVMRPEGEDPDSQVIKILLAITKDPHRRAEPYHIVAEIYDLANYDVAKMVGGDEVELIPVGDLVARVLAQTCRQSGLSIVYTELLDFGGDEIYFKHEPALVGQQFQVALNGYPNSTVIGIHSQTHGTKLNPAPKTVIGDADELIFIAADDSAIHFAATTPIEVTSSAIKKGTATRNKPEHTLILGWNWRTETVLRELDNYVATGSAITVVANDGTGAIATIAQTITLRNQTLTFQSSDTTNRKVLEALPLNTYRHIIVMSYSDTLDVQLADARTLVTLLHLRDIATKGGHHFSIVSEMLDVRNRTLAEVTKADDFIVSDRLVSLLMAQVASNKLLNRVFTDLFDTDGAEVYLKPIKDYVAVGTEVTVATLVESASRRKEVAIGYRIESLHTDATQQYGIVINPAKAHTVTFTKEDMLIVLADA